MGLGDLSFSAIASLRSIDTWTATINANMAGTGRVGFKASNVKFGGGTTSSDRPIVAPRLGINVAEQSLGIAQTKVDYSQGAVVASTSFTHLAIQRTTSTPGMFILVSEVDGATGVPTADASYYYTFDGEFHFDTNGRLVNNDGLFVVADRNGDGVVNNESVIDLDNAGGGAISPDVVNDQLSLNNIAIATFPNPQLQLEFSRYGATIFQETGANSLLAPVAGRVAQPDFVGNYDNATAGFQGSGRIIPNALEASNASLTASTPELALAQKMYAAIAKVISVALQNIDVVLNISR